MQMLGDCIPIKSNNRHYQIECFDGSQFAVDLECKSCSCRRWKLSGIPCTHAIASIVHQKLDPEDFVDDCYKVDTYKKVYEPAILPISGQNEWARTLFIPPLPPTFGRKAGRPTKTRRIELDEKKDQRSNKGKHLKMRRRQTSIKCKKCGASGHNTRSCTHKVPDYTPVQDENEYTPMQAGTEYTSMQVENDYIHIQQESVQKLKVTKKKYASTSGITHEQISIPKENFNVSGVPTRGKTRGRPPKIVKTMEHILESKKQIVLPPKPTLGPVDEDDEEFEALLSATLMSQGSNTSGLGMPVVPCFPGPTPHQQLQNDFTLPSMPHILSGPNIRAPPPFRYGGSMPQFTTKTGEERSLKRIVIDGGHKYLDLSQKSHATGKGKKKGYLVSVGWWLIKNFGGFC